MCGNSIKDFRGIQLSFYSHKLKKRKKDMEKLECGSSRLLAEKNEGWKEEKKYLFCWNLFYFIFIFFHTNLN